MALTDYQFEGYDVPPEAVAVSASAAFEDFITDVFVHSGRNGISATGLSASERELAADVVRRNLGLGYVHIIEAAGELADQNAAAQLREMLATQADASRRLTIAGALWKIERSTVFPECLREMVASDDSTLKETHLNQVTWLGNEQSIDLLIELLDDPGDFVRHQALCRLNEIEHKARFLCAASEFPRGPDEFRAARNDAEFKAMMVKHLGEEPPGGWELARSRWQRFWKWLARR